MKQNIFIRTDGSADIGMGHVIRCVALAQILKDKFNIVFAIQNPEQEIITIIRSVTKNIISLPVVKNFATDSKNFCKYLASGDIVVIDGYHFKTNYQKAIKNIGCTLVCIDDLHAWHHVADVVINHSEGINKNKYSKEYYTKLCLGTPFVILRKSFFEKSFSEKTINPELGSRVFVNMGSSDPKNYTKKAVQQCLKIKEVKAVDIVVGNFYKYTDQLKDIIGKHQDVKIKLHYNLSEKAICSLMHASSSGICAASNISYEYATVGGILFVCKTAPNQKNLYNFLIRSKSAFPLNHFGKKITELSKKKAQQEYFNNRKKSFSGSSKANLLSVFEKLRINSQVKVRRAGMNDLLIYFKWVNDPEVRMNSINTAPVILDNHSKWFASKLKDKNTFLYILEEKNIPIGQIRVERHDGIGTLDTSIDSAFRGKGYGTIISVNAINEYKKKFPSDKIFARIKQDNYASCRVYENLGFKKMSVSVIKGIKYNNYILNPSAS